MCDPSTAKFYDYVQAENGVVGAVYACCVPGLFQCAVLHKSAVLKKFVQFYSVKYAVGKWTISLQCTFLVL